MIFPDKYQLTEKESVFLLKKNIVSLVYNAGKFEGLNTSLLQTEEIIKHNRASNVAVDEVLTIVNLKRGFETLLNSRELSQIETSKLMNQIVAAEDSLAPGQFRTGSVEVSTLKGRYIPPILSEAEIIAGFASVENSQVSATQKALELFLFIAKNQIYWDGNKRTALITANHLMFQQKSGLLSIPDAEFLNFNQLLSDYYSDKIEAETKDDLMQFLYAHCIFGIDY